MNRIRTCALVVCLLSATASLAGSVAPRDPAELGYGELSPVNADDPAITVYEWAETSWRTLPDAQKYGAALNARDDVTARGILKSLEQLRSTLVASATFADGNGPQIRRSLLAELDDFADRLNGDSRGQLVLTTRFLPVTRPPPAQPAVDGIYSSMVFFEGAPNQVILRRQAMEAGPIPGVAVSAGPVYYATPEQAVEFREVTVLVEEILAASRREPFERVTRKLTQIDLGWRNYLERGYSQYPWESVLNSYVTSAIEDVSWYDPPAWQLVALHPEGGFVADFRSQTDSSVEPALLVHGLGVIHYFGEERSWFLGASASISVGDGDFGLGAGPTLHFGHALLGDKLPHLSVSVLWHDFDDGVEGPLVGMSVDLWRLLSTDGPEEMFRGMLSGSP